MRESIRPAVAGSRSVRESEIEPTKGLGPAGLTVTDSLGSANVGQVAVVGPDQKRVLSPLEPVPPFIQSSVNG